MNQLNTDHPKKHSNEDDVLVKVDNVGKIFCRDLRKSLAYGVMDGIGDLLPPLARKDDGEGNPVLRKGEFWANQGVSFELRRGECLGLIGHNGAGKTTLLKMLNGLIKPDTGSIEMRGRVGALIALNAGFNPILTGRENVYITGSVYGMSKKEIDAKFDDIVDFAELWDFIDSPVQNYSSGMQVRLGFAIATAIEPDVLIIDEVLAVGDAKFRFKSAERISSLLTSAAVVFVSHNEAIVRHICERGLHLSMGRCMFKGSVSEAFSSYYEEGASLKNMPKKDLLHNAALSEVSIDAPSTINAFSPYLLKLNFHSELDLGLSFVRIVLSEDQSRQKIAEYNSLLRHKTFSIQPGNNTYSVRVGEMLLRPGRYWVSVRVHAKDSSEMRLRADNWMSFEVKGDFSAHAHVLL